MGENLPGELVDLRTQGGRRNDAVHQAPGKRGLRVDEIAGEEHLQGVLASEIARDADSRRGAENPALDPRQRELGCIARHGQIAHGHELAAGGDRDALHARDHGLRQAHEREHHLAALLEKRLLPGLAGVRAHLAQVVPGAEVLARARKDDHASRRVLREAIELGLQREEHRGRERVHAIAPVERQRRHAVLVPAQDVRRFHFGFGWSVHGVLRHSIAEVDLAC